MKKIIKKFIPFKEMSNKIKSYHAKAYYYNNKGMRLLAQYYSYKIYKKYNCMISPGAKIGKNVYFPHPVGIVIGDGVIIGDNVTIYQNVTLGRKKKEEIQYPIIGNNVIIYSNSVIVGNINVADGTVIGCNSFLDKSTEKNSLYIGIPAKQLSKGDKK